MSVWYCFYTTEKKNHLHCATLNFPGEEQLNSVAMAPQGETLEATKGDTPEAPKVEIPEEMDLETYGAMKDTSEGSLIRSFNFIYILFLLIRKLKKYC